MKYLVVFFTLFFLSNAFSQTQKIIYSEHQTTGNLVDTGYSQIIWLGTDYNSFDYEYLFNHWYQATYDIHLSTIEGHHLLFMDVNNDSIIDMIGNTKLQDSLKVGFAEYQPTAVPIFNFVSNFPDTNIATEVIVDLNNDDENEILTSSNYPFINAYKNNVSFIRRFTTRSQWSNTKPLIADIDDNEKVDFIIDQYLSGDYAIRFFEYDYLNDTLNLVTKIDSMMYRWYTMNGDTVDTLVHVYGDFSDYIYEDLDGDGFIEVATGHGGGYLNIFEKNPDGYQQEYFNNMGTPNMYQIAITNDINLNGKPELIVVSDYDGGHIFWLESDGEDNYSVIRKDFIDYGNPVSSLLSTMYAKDVDSDGKDELVFRGGSLIWILKFNPVESEWDMLVYFNVNHDYDAMWGNGHNRSFPGHITNITFYDIDNDDDNDMFVSTDDDVTLFFESNFSVLGIENPPGYLPKSYFLSQNFPNPFNPITTINYSVPKASNVSLIVYDVIGREIKTLVNGEKLPGNYNVKFNGSELSSGVYFYVLKADGFVDTKKLVLLK